MKQPIPTAIAHVIPGGMISVPRCPYCGQPHKHQKPKEGDKLKRMADCFQGEYFLDIKN